MIVGLTIVFLFATEINGRISSDDQYKPFDPQISQSTIDNQQSSMGNSAIRNPKSPSPWYQRVLRRINPSDFDYGAWLEERRAAFLEVKVTNRYFWYSFWVTMALIVTILAYAKHRSDFHKFTWMSAGWLADFYNEMQFARDNADDAIEKYNQHIEKCNRAIEAELDGSWKQQQTNEEANSWKRQHEDVARLLDESTAERKKLSTTLSERERTITDLAGRIEDLEQRIKGRPFTISGQPLTINDSNKLMMNRINVLERQLREEQNKNKRPRVG